MRVLGACRRLEGGTRNRPVPKLIESAYLTHSRIVATFARTSSMIAAGTFSSFLPWRAPRSSARGWSQRTTPVVLVPAPERDTANPAVRAKLPATGDGEDHGHLGDLVKGIGGDDQDRAPALLLVSFRGIKPHQPDFATSHQISSRPTGLLLSHSRSSFVRRALRSHWASSSSRV